MGGNQDTAVAVIRQYLAAEWKVIFILLLPLFPLLILPDCMNQMTAVAIIRQYLAAEWKVDYYFYLSYPSWSCQTP